MTHGEGCIVALTGSLVSRLCEVRSTLRFARSVPRYIFGISTTRASNAARQRAYARREAGKIVPNEGRPSSHWELN